MVEKAKAKIIGGNMIGQTTNQLVAQFMGSRNLNPKVKEPCYHLMLSLPHHETYRDEQFASLGERHFAYLVVLSQLTGDKAKLTNPALRLSEGELNEGVDKFLSEEIHQYSFFIARRVRSSEAVMKCNLARTHYPISLSASHFSSNPKDP